MPEVMTRTNGPVRVHLDPTNQSRGALQAPGEWGETWRFHVENLTHHNLTCRMRPALKPEDAFLFTSAEISTVGSPERWVSADIGPTARGRVVRIGPRERLYVGIRLRATMPARLTVGLRVVPVGR